MTSIALTSVGSAGATTAALALTHLWPRRALLAECDPAGGSSILAGYLRGAYKHDRGLLQLTKAQRATEVMDELWDQTYPLPMHDHPLLATVPDAMQAPNLARLWSPLATCFRQLGQADEPVDVIVDAGRLGAEHYPMPVVADADVVLVVLRSNTPSVAAVHARLGWLRHRLEDSRAQLQLLLVGAGNPHQADVIARGLDVPVAAVLAIDPVAAELLAFGPRLSSPYPAGKDVQRFESTPLMKSVRNTLPALQQETVNV